MQVRPRKRARPKSATTHETIDESLLRIAHEEVASGRIHLDGIAERLRAAVRATAPKAAANLQRELRRKGPRHLRELRRLQPEFQKHIGKHWGEAIGDLELIGSVFREFGEQLFREGLAQRQLRDPTFRALADLHARACRVTGEIVSLLRNGYPDGAHARWRTLHEIAVVSNLLSTHGRELARRYLYHAFVKMHQAAEDYQLHCQALGANRIPARQMATLQRRRDRWCKAFGKHFTSDWGWATGLNGNPRPSFKFLEKASALESFRPMVATASDDMHAGPLGLQPSDVALHGHGFLLAGASDAGLADPGANAAISLTHIAWARLNASPSIENALTVDTIRLPQADCIQSFARCNEEVRRLTERELATGAPPEILNCAATSGSTISALDGLEWETGRADCGVGA